MSAMNGKENEQLYGRNDQVMLEMHDKIYGSLGIAEQYVLDTVEGNPVTMSNPKEGKFDDVLTDFRVMGKSTQRTTTGAQLYIGHDVTINYPDNTTNTVIQLQLNAGDVFNSGGFVSFYSDVDVSDLMMVQFMSGNPDVTNYGNYNLLNVVKGINKVFLKPYEFVSGQGSVKINIRKNNKTDGSDFDFVGDINLSNIMVSAGQNEVDWEPYTGGQPSPSPDYPQEIHSSGDDGSIQVDVTGANLFSAEFESGGISSLDGSVQDDASRLRTKDMIYLKDAGRYVLNLESHDTKAKQCVIYVYDSAGKFLPDELQSVFGNFPRIFKNNANRNVKFVIRNSDNTEILQTDIKNIMLNIGTNPLPYEPYKYQSLTVQTPNGLPGIPVQSGGNYTDETGQQWVCDEIDFKRGKYVQRIKKYFPAEQLSYISNGALGEDAQTILVRYDTGNNNNKFIDVLMCNFLSNKIIAWSRDKEGYQYSPDGLLDFRIEKIRLSEVTLDGVKQYCSEIGAYFYYAINDPILIDLSEEQLSTYANLHTNRPTTIVSASDEAWMKVTYKQTESK